MGITMNKQTEALKMANYIVVLENDLSALTARVNDLLSKGYSPLGGVSFQILVGVTSFCQAMIVEDK